MERFILLAKRLPGTADATEVLNVRVTERLESVQSAASPHAGGTPNLDRGVLVRADGGDLVADLHVRDVDRAFDVVGGVLTWAPAVDEKGGGHSGK